MKDLQKAIEDIVRETMQEVESLMKSTPPNFAYNEVMDTIYKQRSTKLTQLITSREQEIADDLIKLIRHHQEYDNEFDEAMVNTEYFVGILEKYKLKENK